VWRNPNQTNYRPYSQLDGSERWHGIKKGFQMFIYEQEYFYTEEMGEQGVLWDVFCCLNFNTQLIELYKGSTLLGSTATGIIKTTEANLVPIRE
jgi:hypothetical protein